MQVAIVENMEAPTSSMYSAEKENGYVHVFFSTRFFFETRFFFSKKIFLVFDLAEIFRVAASRRDKHAHT